MGLFIKFYAKPDIEKVYEKNRKKTIPRLLNDIYILDNWVGHAIEILTKQDGFDRMKQKSYEVSKQDATRLEYYLERIRNIDKSIQDNEKFLLQYLEFEEYSIIGSYIKNSANIYIFPEDKRSKPKETVPVFCLPQYMHIRIEYARKLLDRFSVELKPEFVIEWNNFLNNYESPY